MQHRTEAMHISHVMLIFGAEVVPPAITVHVRLHTHQPVKGDLYQQLSSGFQVSSPSFSEVSSS